MRTAFENEGDVRSMDVLAGLVALWREGASGSLQFSRSGSTAGFEFSGGEITATVSSDARFETASILVRAGKLDEATLGRLAVPEGIDRAVVALQAGILTRREWRWGEKIRAVEVLSDLLGWIEGDYLLFRAPAREPGEFRLPVPRLILELFLRSRDRSLVLHYLGGADVPLARSESFDAEFSTFGLTADAESVVRLIDGRSTAAEIASEAPAEAFAVEKLLAALVTLGLVQADFTSGSAVRRPAEATGIAPQPSEESSGSEFDETLDSSRVVPASVPDALGELLGATPTSPQSDGEIERETLGEVEEMDSPDEPEEPEEPEADLDSLEPELYEPETTEPAHSPEPDEPMVDARLRDEDAWGSDVQGRNLATGHDLQAEDSAPPDGPGPEGWGQGDLEPEKPLDLTTGVSAFERPQHRSSAALVWILVALLAGVAGVVWMRSRASGASSGALAAATPTPTEAISAGATELQASAEPTPAPASAAVAAPATPTARPAPPASPTRPRAAAPTARPARPTAVAPSKPAAAAPTESAPEPNRQYWVERAAADAKRWKGDRKARYAIQLELACEVTSLVDAWKHDRPAGTMSVLSTTFQGRQCFRVLWGRYATRDAARKALAGAPAFFTTGRNRPVVTSVR